MVRILDDNSIEFVPLLTQPHEVYEVRGVCTPTRQNQISFQANSSQKYAVFAYSGEEYVGDSHPFVLSTHSLEAVRVTANQRANVAQFHGHAMACIAVNSPQSTVIQIKDAAVYTLSERCRAICAATSTNATDVAWKVKGANTNTFLCGAAEGTFTVTPGGAPLALVASVKNEVWDDLEVEVISPEDQNTSA